jgi:SAM-dependent methyltransferase
MSVPAIEAQKNAKASGQVYSIIPDQRALWQAQHQERAHDPRDRFLPTVFAGSVARFIRPGIWVLELGCAAGRDSIYFAKMGAYVVGCDIADSALALMQSTAADLGVSNMVTGFLYNINEPFRNPIDHNFDIVYCRCSLHVDDHTAKRLIPEIAENMTESGLLCIQAKSTTDPLCGQGTAVGPEMYVSQDERGRGHLRRFWSLGALTNLLQPYFTVSETSDSTEYDGRKSTQLVSIVAQRRPEKATIAPTSKLVLVAMAGK